MDGEVVLRLDMLVRGKFGGGRGCGKNDSNNRFALTLCGWLGTSIARMLVKLTALLTKCFMLFTAFGDVRPECGELLLRWAILVLFDLVRS